MTAFASRLQVLREEMEMTQREMAEALGISKRTYENYETGANEPCLPNAVQIADMTVVSIDWLAGRTNQRRTNK